MKYTPYILFGIVFVAVAAWAYWHWMRSPSPSLSPPTSAAFRMPIEDAFALKVPGKVVVVGKIAEGEVRPGDRLKIKAENEEISVEVEAVEAFGERIAVGSRDKHVGIMLIGATKEQIVKGAVLVR